jgi:hypothetical protein
MTFWWKILLFHPEDEGSIFLQNLSNLSSDYMASHIRRCYSSQLPPLEPQISHNKPVSLNSQKNTAGNPSMQKFNLI